MRRRSLLIAVCLAGLLAAPAAAQIQDRTLLMPGVTFDREVEFTPHGPVVLHVITAPRPDGSLYRLAPVLSNDAVVATEKLTALEKRLAGEATIAAVNGDYYDPNPGGPKGMLIRDGVLDTPPADKRSSIGIAPDGTLQVARVAFAGIWKGTGQRRPLTVNRFPASSVTLYTSAWGPATPPEAGPVATALIPQVPPTRPNTDLGGTVAQTGTVGGVAIPPGGGVLVARGSQAAILQREAPVGTELFLRMALTPDWSGMTGAIGGGPVLVQAGKAVFRANELFPASLLNPRSPRSAVGQTADGKILLVTVDGALGGYSVGMTNFELALALRRLGAVTAMALGSGPVTTMAFDGQLLNRPSGRGEPEVSDALALLYTGVYAAPPSDAVFSPNGDEVAETETLAYRLVRPSTVTASVVGSGGARLVLESGRQGPGLRTFTFTGKRPDGTALPEGGYRFVVAATDDTGRSSSAERAFALNNTLGRLSVTPESARISPRSRGSLAITFDLSRPADVRVTVETRTGLVIRTLAARKLAAGAQKLLWDGRTASGKLAFGGAYLVRVRAANAVGRVELTQPFRARRG